jgi:hypothetical protein
MLFEVAPDAMWKTTWGAEQAYFKMPIETFWEQPVYDVSRSKFVEHDERAYHFGSTLYYDKPWTSHDGAVFTVEVGRVKSMKIKTEDVEEGETANVNPNQAANVYFAPQSWLRTLGCLD